MKTFITLLLFTSTLFCSAQTRREFVSTKSVLTLVGGETKTVMIDTKITVDENLMIVKIFPEGQPEIIAPILKQWKETTGAQKYLLEGNIELSLFKIEKVTGIILHIDSERTTYYLNIQEI